MRAVRDGAHESVKAIERYWQLRAMPAVVPSLAVHWASLVPLNVSVVLPPLNELTAVPDCGHTFLHATKLVIWVLVPAKVPEPMPDKVPLIVAQPVPVGQTSVYMPVWVMLFPSGPVPLVWVLTESVF
jgi:hypothetical protein